MYALSTQILVDIENASANNWVRICCKDGKWLEAYALFFTYETVGGDEDIDALALRLRDGTNYAIIGDDVESFEVLESR